MKVISSKILFYITFVKCDFTLRLLKTIKKMVLYKCVLSVPYQRERENKQCEDILLILNHLINYKITIDQSLDRNEVVSG